MTVSRRSSTQHAALAMVLLLAAATRVLAEDIDKREAFEIGLEAYIDLYPLVLMDVTRRNNINCRLGRKQGLGPVNRFHHMRTYQTVDDRDVVWPNFDTLA